MPAKINKTMTMASGARIMNTDRTDTHAAHRAESDFVALNIAELSGKLKRKQNTQSRPRYRQRLHK